MCFLILNVYFCSGIKKLDSPSETRTSHLGFVVKKVVTKFFGLIKLCHQQSSWAISKISDGFTLDCAMRKVPSWSFLQHGTVLFYLQTSVPQDIWSRHARPFLLPTSVCPFSPSLPRVHPRSAPYSSLPLCAGRVLLLPAILHYSPLCSMRDPPPSLPPYPPIPPRLPSSPFARPVSSFPCLQPL